MIEPLVAARPRGPAGTARPTCRDRGATLPLLRRDRLGKRAQDLFDDELVHQSLVVLAKLVKRLLERNARRQATVLTDREIYANLLFGILAATDVIGVSCGFRP